MMLILLVGINAMMRILILNSFDVPWTLVTELSIFFRRCAPLGHTWVPWRNERRSVIGRKARGPMFTPAHALSKGIGALPCYLDFCAARVPYLWLSSKRALWSRRARAIYCHYLQNSQQAEDKRGNFIIETPRQKRITAPYPAPSAPLRWEGDAYQKFKSSIVLVLYRAPTLPYNEVLFSFFNRTRAIPWEMHSLIFEILINTPLCKRPTGTRLSLIKNLVILTSFQL